MDAGGVEATAGNETTVVVAPPQDGFFRTPFQVLTLGYATFGIYGFYWLIRGRHLAEERLERKPTSYWWYLWWLIPIVAWISGVESAAIIQRRVQAAGVPPPRVHMGVSAAAFFVVEALWRLHDPYWLISLTSPVFLALMASSLSTAERADSPERVWPRFTAWEWVITVVGGLFIVFLALGGLLTDPEWQRPFEAAVYLFIALSLVVAAILEQRTWKRAK